MLPKLSYRSVARSSAGTRSGNEDRVLDCPARRLWAVADGMGGHADGGAAAQSIVDALRGVEHGLSGYAFMAAIEERVAEVNARLFAGARRSGSTLVLLIAHQEHVAWLWAGDSRVYRLRDGRLARLSSDHSVVQALIDGGALPEQRRRGHPQASVITRAIGAAAELALDRGFASTAVGDRFLLCSDGLPLCLEDEDITDLLAHPRLDEAADALLETVLARGAPDNASLVVVEVCGD